MAAAVHVLVSAREGNDAMQLSFTAPDPGEECPISMEPMCTAAVDKYPGASVFPDRPDLTRVELPCKHRFAAFPLVYHFARNSMRCPICRAGSDGLMDISTLNRHVTELLAEQLNEDEIQRRIRTAMENTQAAEELQFSSAVLEMDASEPVSNLLHFANLRIACFLTRDENLLCSSDYPLKIQPGSFEILSQLEFSHLTQQLSGLRVRFGIQNHNMRDLGRKFNQYHPQQISFVLYLRSEQSNIIRPFMRSPTWDVDDLNLFSPHLSGCSSHECDSQSAIHFHRGVSSAPNMCNLVGLEWETPFVSVMQEVMQTEMSVTLLRSMGVAA